MGVIERSMTNDEPSRSDSDPWQPLLRRFDQLTIGVVVGVSLFVMGVYWWQKIGRPIKGINVERDVKFQVDINSADWPDLMVLPELGETRARQIIQWRQDHGSFATIEDVLSIPGIGEKTLEKIRPYLRPISETTGT